MGLEPGLMGGHGGMHGPGQVIGDAHGMRQGMWAGPGGGQGMHPHGQGDYVASGSSLMVSSLRDYELHLKLPSSSLSLLIKFLIRRL